MSSRIVAASTAVLVISVSLIAFSVPAAAGPGGSVLWAGEQLTVGQTLKSPNGHYVLILQGDGNLVLYGPGGGPTGALWASNTSGANRLAMQGDGNLVLYQPNNTAAWATWTQAYPGAWVQLQDDGNLVVYRPGGVAVWSTGVANPYPDLVVDHNIAGSHTPSGDMTNHLRMTTTRLSLAGMPNSITLQEVCGNQAWAFATNLQTLAPGQYVMRFQNNFKKQLSGDPANPTATCTAGYGNFVATKGSGFVPQIAEATYSGSSAFGPTTVETKGYVCLEGGAGSPNHFACSTHFWPSSAGANWSMAQKGAALSTFRSAIDYLFAFRGKVVTGSDLYMSRNEMAAQVPGIFNTWQESFTCGGWVVNSGTLSLTYTYQADHVMTRGTGCAGKSGYVLTLPGCPLTDVTPANAPSATCHGSDHRLLFSRGTF